MGGPRMGLGDPEHRLSLLLPVGDSVYNIYKLYYRRKLMKDAAEVRVAVTIFTIIKPDQTSSSLCIVTDLETMRRLMWDPTSLNTGAGPPQAAPLSQLCCREKC